MRFRWSITFTLLKPRSCRTGGSRAEAITTIRFALSSYQEGNAKRAPITFRVVAEAK
jgi:hypothetical protein